ncbi:MAG TPA: long-chain fatty acid--CoA ligase [Polyangia bacterium]|nr:long-chain fatty acid--CoA ligase [Polyangia bacterium]
MNAPAAPGPAASLEQLRKSEPATAVEMWKRRVAQTPEKIAFKHHDGRAWVGLTWRQADGVAREIAAGLVARGVVPGDRVCVVAQTCLDWILCDIGILLAGGVTVPVYPSNTAEQCEYIVRDAGAKVVIVEDAAQLEKMLGARDRMLTVTSLVHMNGDAVLEKPDHLGRKAVALADVLGASKVDGDYVSSLAAMRAAGKAWLAAHAGELDAHAEVDADSMFTIIYTSGTTGNPKGVVLTHENVVAGVSSAIRAMQIYDTEEQYLFLTLAHVLARELEWAGIALGFTTTISRGVPMIRQDLGETRPTFMASVPRVYEKFYTGVQAALDKGSAISRAIARWALGVGKEASAAERSGKTVGGWLGFKRSIADKLVFSKLRARLGLDRCRFLISGGAPLAAEIAEFFHGVGLLVLEGYGLTETMAAAFLNTLTKYRFGTVGPALDVVEVQIADDGEVLMRGPSVFRQYYNNAAATAEAVQADGWFHSGDIGQIEDGGFLRITDRKKDLIVTANGKKVAPQPLENALKARSPLVSQVVVYGDKRSYCVALVTLSEDAQKKFADAAHVKAGAGGIDIVASPELDAALKKDIDALNAGLAPHETVKKVTVLANDFTEAAGEMTPSLKVKRKIVTEKYRAVIDAMYTSAGGGHAD